MFVRLLHLLLFLSPLYLFTISAASAQTSNVRVYTARDGLADDYITAIAFEPNGSAWVGASKGVTHISDDGWVSYTRAHGLGDSFITSIAVAPDGKIWFGTQSGGVSVLDPISKTITTYNLNNSEIPSNFVTALAVDPANRVWVGTLNHGIARYDGATGRWTQFEFPEREITALALDGENAPWVGTPNGVFHFDGTNWFQDKNVGDAEVKRIDAFGGEWYLTAKDGRYILQNDEWVANDGADEITKALNAANVQDSQVTAFGKDEQQRYWLGTRAEFSWFITATRRIRRRPTLSFSYTAGRWRATIRWKRASFVSSRVTPTATAFRCIMRAAFRPKTRCIKTRQ